MKRDAVLEAGDCAGCELWRYCHGGCPVDSLIYHHDWQHKTYFCEARKVFLRDLCPLTMLMDDGATSRIFARKRAHS